jgi:predicted nucleic acid-binding Zn ribbon protein
MLRRRRRPDWRACVVCGTQFLSFKIAQRCCSVNCGVLMRQLGLQRRDGADAVALGARPVLMRSGQRGGGE